MPQIINNKGVEKHLILPVNTNVDKSYYDSVGDVVFLDYIFSDNSRVLTTFHECPITGSLMPALIVGIVDADGMHEFPPEPKLLKQSECTNSLSDLHFLAHSKEVTLELVF